LGVRGNYAVHLRLIGKPVGDFPLGLVIIEPFPLGVTAEPLRANIGCKSPF